MNLLPAELISYIATYQHSLYSSIIVNKEFSNISKNELIVRRSTLLNSFLYNKLTIIKNNNIFFNSTAFINTGVYKVYSDYFEHRRTSGRAQPPVGHSQPRPEGDRLSNKPFEYNHLFISSDRYQSYINRLNTEKLTSNYWRAEYSDDETFEFCLVNIEQKLTPGYISFERYKF